MLKVVLTVDCEGFISFKQVNPKWTKFEHIKGIVNKSIKNIRYNKNGFELIYQFLLEQDFPVTLMLVGNLFEPREKTKFIDYGYHTLNHVPLTLVDDKTLKKEVQNKYNSKAFTAPMWMIETLFKPNRIFDALKDEGYTSTVYKGMQGSHSLKISKPIKKQGIKCIHLSNTFEGNSPKEKINKILNEIVENSEKDAVYCLSTHDFTHKNTMNLQRVVRALKQMQKQNMIEVCLLKEINL